MLLAELSNAAGASGNEGAIRKLIIPAIRQQVDDLLVDTMGNVYASKRAAAPNAMTVMIAAHMDEVGFMITDVSSKGMLKFTTVGGFDPRVLPGKVVLVGKDQVPGVIGTKAIHNLEAGQYDKAPGLKSLRIDIGANSKESAQSKVSPGDYAVFATRFEHLNGDPNDKTSGIVKGKALDDRVGCAVLIELLKEDYPVNGVGAFTVQEEIGLRGAQVAAHRVAPDLAIVLECTTADDQPEKDKELRYPRLGDGPCLTIMDRSFIANRRLVELVETVARERDIPYQYKWPALGGTDAGAIHKSRAGVPSLTIAAPSRYIHSPAALMDLRDFYHTIALVKATLQALPDKWK